MLKIAYLVPKNLYETKMSRGARFMAVEAVGDLPDAEMIITGVGWPDWDDSRSVTWNLTEIGFVADVIWAYKPDDLIEAHLYPALRVLSYNETWPDRPGFAREEVRAFSAGLVIHHHQDGYLDLQGANALTHHIPHAASQSAFTGQPEALRLIPAILTGVISDEIYPVRGKMKRAVESGKIPGTVVRHPGYRLRSASACDEQYRAYGRVLQTAKISLCCTSKYRYALAKLFESAMAGCVVATDMPDDSGFRETLGGLIIEIDRKWSEEEIADCINDHLANPGDLRDRGIATRECALQNFTLEHYAQKANQSIRAAIRHIAENNAGRPEQGAT